MLQGNVKMGSNEGCPCKNRAAPLIELGWFERAYAYPAPARKLWRKLVLKPLHKIPEIPECPVVAPVLAEIDAREHDLGMVLGARA